MKVDLHCHTNISDCSLSFCEIIDLAKLEGVGCLAITNHDTTQGLEEMAEAGKREGVEIIPGIEISAYDFSRNRRVHILGYFVEPGHPALEELCAPLLDMRHHASYVMVNRLIEAGYNITWEQIAKYASGGTGVYKQHIMHALIDSGYTSSIYGDVYRKLFSRGQNGEAPGIAFVPMKYVDARSAIRAIIQAGGIPVLAHPGQYGNFDAVPELVESGLAGIEVWHPLHGSEDEARAREYAEQYGLIMTGGSDFHGFYGETDAALGCKDPGIECVIALKAKKGVVV
ncbi:PHP domain-containing protein [Paenibacillus alkaliterrae]|uniref:PHP domain-containing protein n=1 Tax=Paenibacillus alkaliterrae TaxID=320909 RepID=UPI001F2CA826|nr:PHP domain-containing protein [Paenibacillus alkaliterrae]MCF2940013.1 PHP domain-containing protein [Paenibacillus alkaliterrae]